MTTAALMSALADRLATVTGVTGALSYEPDQLQVGLAWPVINGTTYNNASDSGLDELDVTVMITTGRQSARIASERLYELLDKATVAEHLQADRTLGGACQDLTVRGGTPVEARVGDEIYPAIMFAILIFL